MNADQLLEALTLGEDYEIEFKSARGGVPRSLWESGGHRRGATYRLSERFRSAGTPDTTPQPTPDTATDTTTNTTTDTTIGAADATPGAIGGARSMFRGGES